MSIIKMKKKGFTLIELLMVIVIIAILAAISLPNYTKAKESALGKEAKSNLSLMAAAEKIYRMETNTYYPSSGTVTAIADINSNLKIDLTETNWDYAVSTGIVDAFRAQASRKEGPFSNCWYYINEFLSEPRVGGGDCP